MALSTFIHIPHPDADLHVRVDALRDNTKNIVRQLTYASTEIQRGDGADARDRLAQALADVRLLEATLVAVTSQAIRSAQPESAPTHVEVDGVVVAETRRVDLTGGQR